MKRYERNGMEYYALARYELDGILNQSGETYEPRGLFVCRDRVGAGTTVYTAMRNLDGSGLTEEFRSLVSAVRWLHGMTVQKRCYYRAEGMSQNELADILEEAGVPCDEGEEDTWENGRTKPK